MKKINGELYYSITEVGYLVDKTKLTILRWYEFEQTLPEQERLLPPYIEWGNCNTKFIKVEDMDKVYEFIKHKKRGNMKNISDKYNGTLVNNN